MGRPKRNVQAAAQEASTPPAALTPTQSLARVNKATGNNLYSCSIPNGREILVELPSRFRNTIWIKRGGYVLVDTKDAGVRENKIDGEIVNVVGDEREWRKEAYWYVPRFYGMYLAKSKWLGRKSLSRSQHTKKTQMRTRLRRE